MVHRIYGRPPRPRLPRHHPRVHRGIKVYRAQFLRRFAPVPPSATHINTALRLRFTHYHHRALSILALLANSLSVPPPDTGISSQAHHTYSPSYTEDLPNLPTNRARHQSGCPNNAWTTSQRSRACRARSRVYRRPRASTR